MTDVPRGWKTEFSDQFYITYKSGTNEEISLLGTIKVGYYVSHNPHAAQSNMHETAYEIAGYLVENGSTKNKVYRTFTVRHADFKQDVTFRRAES